MVRFINNFACRVLWLLYPSLAQTAIEENCSSKHALSGCLKPQAHLLQPDANHGLDYYTAASIRYFLTMKSDQSEGSRIALDSDLLVTDFERDLLEREWNPLTRWFNQTTIHPLYGPLVIRYEFPPWLLTTGYGVVTMKNISESLRLYETDYQSIDCRSFSEQPFGRCHVVFLYGRDDPSTTHDERIACPIYEEFTFNDAGAITFIEAWTDHPDYLPMEKSDYWAELEDVKRLSTAVPGLGNASGLIDPRSESLRAAATAFDAKFVAPYWNSAEYRQGPFTGMLDDINGKLNGRTLRFSSVLSFWPAWTKRTLRHLKVNILEGCFPPDA